MKLKKVPYYGKILTKLTEIDPFIIVDIPSCLISDKQLKRFMRFLPASFSGFYQQGIVYITTALSEKREYWEDIMHELAKINTDYLEHSSYLSFDREQLKAEFDKDMVPSLHSVGIAPEMLIFYYYSKYKFNHPDIPFLIEYWKKKNKEIEEYNQIIHNLELSPPLRGSQAEIEINEYAAETDIKPPLTHDLLRPIAKKLDGIYDEKNKTVTLKRGVAVYFYNKLNMLLDAEEWFDMTLKLISKQAYFFNRQVDKVMRIKKEKDRFFDENTKLKKKVKRIEKEKANLLNLKKNTPDTTEKENAELKKKLTHALSRIDQLEEQITILEKAKEINKEIEENLPIIMPKKEIDIPNYGLIIISGGKWNSKTKEKTELFFTQYDIEVEFIPAENTLKRQDRITNADLIIFDTSRHAHKYYNKIKELNKNILHIRNSDVKEIEELFEL